MAAATHLPLLSNLKFLPPHYLKIFLFNSPIFQMPPRKRASSDQIRDQAKRNVRQAKNKSTTKGPVKGPIGSSRRSSPPLPPTIPERSDPDEGGELENGLSGTDVDEGNLEEESVPEVHNYPRRKEDGMRGKKNSSKDIHTMALAAGKSSTITLVSSVPRLKCGRELTT